MNPFVDPIEAANVLAAAATKVVDRWAVGDLAGAVRSLSDALQYYENAQSNNLELALTSVRSGPVLAELAVSSQKKPPLRFAAALTMIDARAQNVPGIAHGLIAACVEVVAEQGMPPHDPAVRLLASQLVWVCEVDGSNDVFAELVNECHRRSKNLSAGSLRAG